MSNDNICPACGGFRLASSLLCEDCTEKSVNTSRDREVWIREQLDMANTDFLSKMVHEECASNRSRMWKTFASKVATHIDTYTVPQYGDYPNDQVTAFTVEDYKTNLLRYMNRIGKNARGKEEALRDCLKIAHCAQMLHYKLLEQGLVK